MAKRRTPEMTLDGWLNLARSKVVENRIASHEGLDDFQAIVHTAARRDNLDWDEAVAILHMVYGWMPTMLRPIAPHSPEQRRRSLTALQKARAGGLLNTTELADVQHFANRSVVGASKLLHVISPESYVIWDSRVAEVFMWKDVTRGAYATPYRYDEYMTHLRSWEKDPEVADRCAQIRKLNSALNNTGNLRLIELVLFRGRK